MDKKELEQVLDKYFKTLEVLNEEQKALDEQKALEEQNALEKQQVFEENQLNNIEFQQMLLQEIKVLQQNTQYANNQFYVFLIALGLIYLSTLFYKFLKQFI